MAHDTAAKIRENVRRRGGLGKNVRSVDLAIELAKLKMTSSASLMHKVNTQIYVLGALTAANGALRPGNTRLVVSKDRSRPRLRIAKIGLELATIDHLLNHGRGRDKLRFG